MHATCNGAACSRSTSPRCVGAFSCSGSSLTSNTLTYVESGALVSTKSSPLRTCVDVRPARSVASTPMV